MIGKNAWALALKISPQKLAQWQEALPAGRSLLSWLLENEKISVNSYLAWAKRHFEIPILSSDFFAQKLDWSELTSIFNQYEWSEECLPVAIWDNTVFIACYQPQPQARLSFSHQFVIAHPKDLKRSWLSFSEYRKSMAALDEADANDTFDDQTLQVSPQEDANSPINSPLGAAMRPPMNSTLHSPGQVLQSLEEAETEDMTVEHTQTLTDPPFKNDIAFSHDPESKAIFEEDDGLEEGFDFSQSQVNVESNAGSIEPSTEFDDIVIEQTDSGHFHRQYSEEEQEVLESQEHLPEENDIQEYASSKSFIEPDLEEEDEGDDDGLDMGFDFKIETKIQPNPLMAKERISPLPPSPATPPPANIVQKAPVSEAAQEASAGTKTVRTGTATSTATVPMQQFGIRGEQNQSHISQNDGNHQVQGDQSRPPRSDGGLQTPHTATPPSMPSTQILNEGTIPDHMPPAPTNDFETTNPSISTGQIPIEAQVIDASWPTPEVLSDITNLNELAAYTFQEMGPQFTHKMLILPCNGEYIPLRWTQHWKHPLEDTTLYPVNISSPNIFRIVTSSRRPFHGPVTPNAINDEFFRIWNQGEYPSQLTAFPVLNDSQAVTAILVGATKGKHYRAVLSHLQKLSEEILPALTLLNAYDLSA